MTVPAVAQIFDSQDVLLLSRNDHYESYSDVWGFVGTDGREYVIHGTNVGTAWWDVQDPVNPVEVGFIPGPESHFRDMFVIGNYAYVGTEGGGGLQIVDIADPTNPTLVGAYTDTFTTSHNIFGDVARELIYAVGTDSGGGLHVLDASNPTALVEVGAWQNDYVHDVSIEGTRAYISGAISNTFRILDMADPSNPVQLGTTFPDDSNHSSWPFGDSVHVIVAAERSGGHIRMLDISDVNSAQIVAEDDPAPGFGNSMHNPHIEGSLLYCAWYVRGTRIYDVSDPTNLVEIGFFDTFPGSGGLFSGNWGVYPHLPSGLIAASDGSNGLFLMRYDPDVAVLEGTIESSSGGVLDGASVDLLANPQSLVTDATGAYRFTAAAGSWDICASAYAHWPDTVSVAAGVGATATTPIVLVRQPSGGVAGRVTDASSGLPLEGVEVALPGTPLVTETDANGDYAFPSVPTVPGPDYDLQVMAAGYEIPDGAITLQVGTVLTRDFELEPAAAYVDFSDPSGWTVTNDVSTTSGFWEFGEPKGTYASGILVAPEFDHTMNPENQAAVTGNMAGNPSDADVDDGATRLLSPVYDLSGMLQPHVFYYRWYAISEPDDLWQTDVTTDGGASWMPVESTGENDAFWKSVVVDLTGITGSAPAVQFRFTCEDLGDGQIVEGALDDFALFDAAAGAVDVALPVKSLDLDLYQNFPNPLGRSTTIGFAVSRDEHVTLSVFDVTGRRVATLLDRRLSMGMHAVEWDGRVTGGGLAAAGTYFYKLRTAQVIKTRKMVVVR